MHAGPRVSQTVRHENPGFSRRARVPTASRDRPPLRWVSQPRGRRLPRVDPSTTRRWRIACRERGDAGPVARPVSGRPSTLTAREKIARRWLTESPLRHGLETEWWTAARLGPRIGEELGVAPNPRYLGAWLRDRGLPRRSRNASPAADPRSIAAWLGREWPRIKKGAAARRPHRPDRREGPADGPAGPLRWASRGPTPELVQESGAREKVSVAAAVWLSPRRDRLGLFSHTPANGDFDGWHIAAFLKAMLKELAGALSSPGTADRCTEASRSVTC